MPRGVNDYDAGELQGRNVANSNSVNIISPGLITNGLVLHVDAGNFVSYPIAGTTWFDLSGNGNNGTLTNGPTYSRSGGGSIVFSNSVANFVNFGADIALAQSWTLSAFVNLSSVANAQIIVSRSANGPFIQNYNLYIESNDNKFRVSTSASSYAFAASTTSILGSWNHATGTYEATSRVLSIYVNGVFEASTTISADPPTTGASQYTTIGANDGLAGANRVNGNIAFAQIYNRALTPTEIQQNFNATRARFGV